MLNNVIHKTRINFDEGFDLFPDKYVLLGYVEEFEGNIVSGIPIATAERDERDAIWDLFMRYLKQKTHGELFLNYFGDVDSSGVYL